MVGGRGDDDDDDEEDEVLLSLVSKVEHLCKKPLVGAWMGIRSWLLEDDVFNVFSGTFLLLLS